MLLDAVNNVGLSGVPTLSQRRKADSPQHRDTLLASVANGDRCLSKLPMLATANDAREIARYLRGNSSVITISELLNTKPRRIFDKQKIRAYEYWGIICRDGEIVKLTELGRELAERTFSERNYFRQILLSISPYQAGIRWVASQNSRIITFQRLIDFWKSNHSGCLAECENRELEAVAASFFSLCQAAEYGMMTIGKRQQPTRFTVDLAELQDLSFSGAPTESFLQTELQHGRDDVANPRDDEYRVYLSAPNTEAVSNLVELLKLADFPSIVTNDVRPANNFFEAGQLAVMQSCKFGVFMLDSTDCVREERGDLLLRSDKILEINIALALYGHNVVLCWNGNDRPPLVIGDIKVNLIRVSELDWETHMRIVKMVKRLKQNLNLI